LLNKRQTELENSRTAATQKVEERKAKVEAMVANAQA